MTQQEIISSTFLGQVVLYFNTAYSDFKELLKQAAPAIIADIESASVNPECSCRDRVALYVKENAEVIGALLFKYAEENGRLETVKHILNSAPEPSKAVNVSGKVAKTTINDWPAFAESVSRANMNFRQFSTSIVGDDVYVFFL